MTKAKAFQGLFLWPTPFTKKLKIQKQNTFFVCCFLKILCQSSHKFLSDDALQNPSI
jgi:hypothetical protein